MLCILEQSRYSYKQYCAEQRSTVQLRAEYNSTVQFRAEFRSTVQFRAEQRSTVQLRVQCSNAVQLRAEFNCTVQQSKEKLCSLEQSSGVLFVSLLCGRKYPLVSLTNLAVVGRENKAGRRDQCSNDSVLQCSAVHYNTGHWSIIH